MTSVSELFPKCNKLAYDARQQLLQIQQQQKQYSTPGGGGGYYGGGGVHNNAATLNNTSTSDLFMVLEELDRQLTIMEEELVLRESPAQREKWKRKIQDLRQVSNQLREQGQAAEQYQFSQQSQYHSQREELLQLRRRKGGTDDDGDGSNLRNRKRNQNGSSESDMQLLAAEGEAWESSHRMVNQYLDQGSASLSNLVRQRQQLRSVRGMINNIGNRLGLTQSTMRIIERRDITDAYLVAACMVVTLLVIYFLWF